MDDLSSRLGDHGRYPALTDEGTAMLEKEFNNYKYYRTVGCMIGAMSVFTIAIVFIVRTTFSARIAMAVATGTALLYAYVISGMLLKRRFKRLGTTLGKTPDEIVTAVGEADEVGRIANDIVLLSWTSTTYNVELEFSNETCTTDLKIS